MSGSSRARVRRLWRAAAVGLVGLAALAFTAGTASAGLALPGAGMNIEGVAYQPAPSDYTGSGTGVYYDTDFFNSDFAELWGTVGGQGRADLATLKGLGVNFLRLYNWNPARNHLPFLNEALKQGIKIAVPISNYFVFTNPSPALIQQIVAQAYVDQTGQASTVPHPAIAMWTVSNEYDLFGGGSVAGLGTRAASVATAVQSLVAAESALNVSTRLPVSAPVSFSDAFGTPSAIPATTTVMNAIESTNPGFLASRYVAAVNTFNPASDLTTWLGQFKAQVPNTMVWFSELGTAVANSCNGYPASCTPSEQQQATYLAAQLAATKSGAEGVSLGAAVFEFENETWKGGTEATFGIFKFADPDNYTTVPTSGGSYRVDQLVAKASATAVSAAFGSGFGGFLGAGGFLGGVATGGGGSDAGSQGGMGTCDPLFAACGSPGQEPEPPVFVPPPSESGEAPAVGLPAMPNLRARASAGWQDNVVRVRVRVLISRPKLVGRSFRVRVRIPALGLSREVRVSANRKQVRRLSLAFDGPASLIDKRVVVTVDPADRVVETRERDNTVTARIS